MVSLVALGIGETILFPHLLKQWSSDRNIGFWHVVLGGTVGGAGLLGLIYIIKKQYQKKNRVLKHWWWKFALCYLLVQLAASLLQGVLGEVLYGFKVLDYEAVITFLYVFSEVVQSLIRMFFTYVVFVKLYDTSWKEMKGNLIGGVIITVVLYSVPCILQIVMPGVGFISANNAWSVLWWISIIVYFGENFRERTKNV